MSLDQYIHKGFYQWGKIVYKLRFIFIIIPLLITGGLAFGFMYKEEQTNNVPESVFTPIDGRWRYEMATVGDHWPLTNGKFTPGKSFDYTSWNDIVIMPKNRGDNILEPTYLKEIEKVNNYILKNIKTTVQRGNKSYDVFYDNLCLDGEGGICYANDHVTFLKNIRCQDLEEFQGKNDNATLWAKDFCEDIFRREVKVTYPIGRRGQTPVYLGEAVGGVNITDEAGHFDYAKAIRLTYNLKQNRDGEIDFDRISGNWQKELENYILGGEASEIIDFGLYNNDSIPNGLLDISNSLVPYFAITFLILILFATLCSFVLLKKEKDFLGIDWTRSKPIFAVAGVFTAGLSIVCSLGTLLFCGMEYNAIVTVMPFMIISIGVDNMFIMTAAWHRTNPKDQTNIRLGDCLSESAVSITITSLTDFLAFAIGCYTVLPGVWMFCSYTALGILYSYIYQITFFAAIMALTGDLENSGRHASLFVKTVEPEKADTVIKKLFLTGSHLHQGKLTTNRVYVMDNPSIPYSSQPHIYDPDEEETLVSKFFRYVYGPFLLKTVTKVVVFILFIIYITFAIIGLLHVKEGLNPRHLLRNEHYMGRYYAMMTESFYHEGLQVTVVVNNSPDLSNSTEMKDVEQMVRSFEGTAHTMNRNATLFFYDEFKTVIDKWRKDYFLIWNKELTPEEERDGFFDKMKTWLLWSEGRDLWVNDLEWNQNETNITAFRFQIGLKDLESANDQRECAEILREMASKYPYNITTFNTYWPYADQYEIIIPTLLRNIAIATVCMIVVAFVLIPSIPCALLIISSVISIDISVIGYMSFWGVHLDCISVITIIMSIGFAVDLSAHISYGYVRAQGTTEQRAIKALETLGWPVFQGAFSTIIGTMMLAAVDAYIVKTFFKTVFLVIVFGMIHSLVFLPIALTVVLPLWDKYFNRKKKSTNEIEKNGEGKIEVEKDNETKNNEMTSIEVPIGNGN